MFFIIPQVKGDNLCTVKLGFAEQFSPFMSHSVRYFNLFTAELSAERYLLARTRNLGMLGGRESYT